MKNEQITIKNYVEYAIKTEKINENLKTSLGDEHARTLHAVMGLVTEVTELVQIVLPSNGSKVISGVLENSVYKPTILEAFQMNSAIMRAVSYVQKEHLIEELGDCFWYAAIICDVLKKDFKTYIEEIHKYKIYTPVISDVTSSVEAMRQISSKLLDVYKKYIFYGKEVNKELFEILFTSFLSILYDIINDIRSSLQIKASNIELLEYILQMNVDKLKTRYPEAYL